jgi:hypothetical protein
LNVRPKSSAVKTVLATSTLILIANLVGAMILAYLAVSGTSGSDFTWRMQAILPVLRLAAPLGLALAVAVVALGRKTPRNSARQACRIVGLCCLVAGSSLSYWIKGSLEDSILTWNPNWPPNDWLAVRHRWEFWNWIRIMITGSAFVCLICSRERILTSRANRPDRASSDSP